MNPWLTHLKAFYAKNKGKMSYAQAMKAAKSTYTKKGKTEKVSKRGGKKSRK